MTDLLEEEVNADGVNPDARICKEPGCETELPPDANYRVKYCEEHRRDEKGRPVNKPADKRRTKKDGPPPSIKINLGSAAQKKDQDEKVAKVTAAATAMVQLFAGGFLLVGDQVCATNWTNAAPIIGAQLGELAKYHPGLVTFFSPAEIVGADTETGAWIRVAIALVPPMAATAAHHHVLPEKAAGMAAAVAGVVDGASPAA